MAKVKYKRSKGSKIITILFNILQIIACGFLIYSILLLSNIETKLIYLGVAIIAILNIGIIFLLRMLTRKNKIAKTIIFIVISLILTLGQAYIGFLVFRGYSSLDNINKSKITYESDIVVMAKSELDDIGNLKDKKIGIVVDESSIDGYILGLEIIEDNKLEDSATVVEYENNSSLVADLYSGTIDAAIISSNYVSMFKSIDNYKNIVDDTKVIYKKEKVYTKEEIAKLTGDEIVNFNQSNSVTEPFTVLIMGIDSTNDTLEKNATGNGDALMLVT